MALTPRQSRFVTEYLVDLNATQAAIRAGYSAKTAGAVGSENLKKPEIRAAVDGALERRSNRVEVKADDILRELLLFARADIGKAYDENGNLLPVHKMPEEVRRAIAGIKVFEEFEGHGDDRVKVGEVREVKFWDKVRGLELLGKHLKLFTDKVEHEAGASLEQLVLESMGKASK